ncbi:MAG TPA: NADH-quinone oxidoreductase subunit D [Actinomycetota bacterium]|nr:NADH-quinone oxidoreductase subunit D [Actinomycetota bacterium]
MSTTEMRTAGMLPGGPGEGVQVLIAGQGDLPTQEMTLSIGPQHPSTHGVLRVVLEMDGERIKRATPVIGYMHRGFDKLAEVRDYRQVIALSNRHDWLSAFGNELGVVLAVERLMEIEVPERAQWIRMLMAEWNRILNHLMFLGSFGLELGAMTPMFYAFREREDIQSFMEMVTGARLHYTYCRVGGLKEDLPKGALKLSESLVKRIRHRLLDYSGLLLGNEIFKQRTVGIGVLPGEIAKSHGVTGPILHASGIAEDARKTEPYLKYDQVDFDVPIGENGDSYDRFVVLYRRIEESLNIIEQVHAKMPAGAIMPGKMPKNIKPPEGWTYARVENSLGETGYYLVSRGEKEPWRLKMRTPSFHNVSMIPYLLEGVLLPDLIAVLGSVFFVVGDVDR